MASVCLSSSQTKFKFRLLCYQLQSNKWRMKVCSCRWLVCSTKSRTTSRTITRTCLTISRSSQLNSFANSLTSLRCFCRVKKIQWWRRKTWSDSVNKWKMKMGRGVRKRMDLMWEEEISVKNKRASDNLIIQNMSNLSIKAIGILAVFLIAHSLSTHAISQLHSTLSPT